jgi:hypothetical protein
MIFLRHDEALKIILVFEMDLKRILVFSVVDYLLLKYNFQQLSYFFYREHVVQ